MRNVSSLETVFRDYRREYGDKVQFFYVYKSLAHPETNGFVPPISIQERLLHIAKAKSMMKTEMAWICDTMDNEVKEAFGRTYNGEFIIAPDGKLVRKRYWSDPQKLRDDLASLIGPIKQVTTTSDLPTVFTPELPSVASGVVNRPALPRGLFALKLQPAQSDEPHFAKLRVESTDALTGDGDAPLIFTVYLDPLYKVHWNNRAGKVHLQIDGPQVADNRLSAIEVKPDADVDPRWLKTSLRTKGLKPSPFNATLTYTVCDDAQTFCKTIKQTYLVTPERDRSAGTRPGIFLNGLFKDVRKFDKNHDGVIVADELPTGQKTLYIGHMDFNGNSKIESDEIDRFMKMFNRGRGITSGNDGSD